MSKGTMGVLSVGAGDTKLSFDKDNVAERIRSARIVTDMIRRGYILLVEVEIEGKKQFQRVLEFDETKCEYIIADMDPLAAAKADQEEGERNEPSAETTRREGSETPSQTVKIAGGGKRGRPTKRVDAGKSRGVAVARSAGG
jgi:hypothetical protein